MSDSRNRVAILLCLLLTGCGESVAEYRSNEDRDQRIKSAEIDQFHSEERLQRQIDELRGRIEKLEADRGGLNVR